MWAEDAFLKNNKLKCCHHGNKNGKTILKSKDSVVISNYILHSRKCEKMKFVGVGKESGRWEERTKHFGGWERRAR